MRDNFRFGNGYRLVKIKDYPEGSGQTVYGICTANNRLVGLIRISFDGKDLDVEDRYKYNKKV